ncbi:hypothetical protein EV14_1064 [Prochlorococcus sp. MIT 0703]|nr:hypothetical protein EV12_2131 [Prochlorococcus sp. MIT 0701]KGG34867.1 hypothetical protein EV14_1064 [Prochlorococcus sp. MIT 0703]
MQSVIGAKALRYLAHTWLSVSPQSCSCIEECWLSLPGLEAHCESSGWFSSWSSFLC